MFKNAPDPIILPGDPPAAAYSPTPDRAGTLAEAWLQNFSGIVQADAFSGFGRLYGPARQPGPITEAGCWSRARRKFFELAELRQVLPGDRGSDRGSD